VNVRGYSLANSCSVLISGTNIFTTLSSILPLALLPARSIPFTIIWYTGCRLLGFGEGCVTIGGYPYIKVGDWLMGGELIVGMN
jgi:hypothetical protein